MDSPNSGSYACWLTLGGWYDYHNNYTHMMRVVVNDDFDGPYASGQDPVVIGKPAEAFFQIAIDRIALPAERIGMVGDDVIGVHAFHMPSGATSETRRLYHKIVVIGWRPDFIQYGDAGGHTDTTNASFVRHVIAPLVMREGPRHLHVHPEGTARTHTPQS